jgi:UDP-N-acetylglucosamine--N-acetylmuramyl-(pentapeptide) pyrophosphoryl-undecaprenol N-acetylglucosamine transferase
MSEASGKRILLTGGGSAGHVTPNLALIDALTAEGWEVHYAGSADGIERRLVEGKVSAYHVVPVGKLRRYFSWENARDLFRVMHGLWVGWRIVGRLRPRVIFSKGGFVSVPAVVGGALRGIPVLAHESDFSPGLATRLVAPFVTTVCTTFRETRVPRARQLRFVGSPLRPALWAGDRTRGLTFLGFSGKRPVLLVVGGSLGATALNAALRSRLAALTARYDIVHLCGAGKEDPALEGPAYRQFAYLDDAYGDVLAAADRVVSRAGANGLFELLALRKISLLVPLGRGASRGDQLENSAWATAQGYALTVNEAALEGEGLDQALAALDAQAPTLAEALGRFEVPDALAEVMALLRPYGASSRKVRLI